MTQTNKPDIYNHVFYFIDFETSVATKDGMYPSEIAIIKFSMKQGEFGHFHRFINPGPIPAE
jgi:hypothetical protein